MSTAATNNTDIPNNPLAGMSPMGELMPSVVEQELAALRRELADARNRLTLLEQHVACDFSESNATRVPVAMDSPAMQFALALCQEVYPGCRVVPELMFDPESPARAWYSLNIHWKGASQDLTQRDLTWHRRFGEAFPEASHDFCLCSLPE